MDNLNNLTIVVCTKNSEHLIDGCLKKIKESAPESELIVIDGDSIDRTVQIARVYADKIISDERRGLSYARQLGIDNAKNNFVAFIGPDNNVPRETFISLLSALDDDEKLAGIQPTTLFYKSKNYWEWATEYIFKLILNNTGFVDVIGTPCIFKRDILLKYRYDEAMTFGTDDTVVCMKLLNAGYVLKRVALPAFENQNLNFKTFFARWKAYGGGDAQFYNKYSKSWNFIRKVRSIFHPLRKYAFFGSLKAIKNNKPALIPALFVATTARYYGWIKKII